MGVPFFFSWIARECPQMIKEISDQSRILYESLSSSTHSSPSSNRHPIDHLYLDLNGVIHTFKEPNLQTKLLEKILNLNPLNKKNKNNTKDETDNNNIDNNEDNEEEVIDLTMEKFILSIMLYIEAIVYYFPPKKTLYLALDGVAPLAKVNQQRKRRWIGISNKGLPKREIRREDDNNNEEEVKQQKEILFDSTSITAGTFFMQQLSKHLNFFIKRKVQDDKTWKEIETIYFNDSSISGEGEHKIMDYIRQNTIGKNESHCIYGMDSDLIILALSTHEEQFYVLRDYTLSIAENQSSHLHWKIKKRRKRRIRKSLQGEEEYKFHLLDVSKLRDYIENFMKMDNLMTINVDRVIDDFILMLFLCGNDFLPSLPTLDIGKEENSLSYLFQVYKKLFINVFKGNYITNTNVFYSVIESNENIVELLDIIHLDRFEKFVQVLGSFEQQVLTNRLKKELLLLNEKKKQQEQEVKSKKQQEEIIEPSSGEQKTNEEEEAIEDLQIVKSNINPEQYKNILPMIDLTKVECLNITKNSDIEKFLTFSSIIGATGLSSSLASGFESELMLKIPFKQPLSLTCLLLKINEDNLDGVVVKLFTNKGDLDFSSLESIKPTQEFKETDLKLAMNQYAGEIKLKVNLFQNVSHLTIFITNQKEQESTTTLNQCILFGIAPATMSNIGTLKLLKRNNKNRTERKRNYFYRQKKKVSPNVQYQQEDEKSKKFKVLSSAICLKKKEGLSLNPPYIDVEKWKINYYKKKENLETKEQVERIVRDYVIGLCWIFHYYYAGVPDWEWYYCHHYAPVASDLKDLKKLLNEPPVCFVRKSPLSVIEGLLAVLPPSSANLIKGVDCNLPEDRLEKLVSLITKQDSPLSPFCFDMESGKSLEETAELDPNDEGLKTSLRDPFYHYARMVVRLPFVNIEVVRKAARDILQDNDINNSEGSKIKTFKWDTNVNEQLVKSTLSVLPDIEECHTKVEEVIVINNNQQETRLSFC
ncbi:hypothetical protein ABK040_008466 [Willaertia magna]